MFRLSVLLSESGAGGGTVGLTGIGSSNSAGTTRPTPAVLQAFLRLLAATLPNIRRLPRRAASENAMFRKYAYGWITLGFFLGALLLHWYFGWLSFVDEAQSHGQAPEVASYTNEMLRDTFENWQSEFLQLLWQVLGLAYFLYIGSPSSKENDDRLEAKLDAVLRAVGGDKADLVIEKIDKEYERETGHAPHAHGSEVSRNAGREIEGMAVKG